MDVDTTSTLPSPKSKSKDKWAALIVATGHPGDAVFSVPLHWHKRHSERMTVLEGRVELTLDGTKRILQAGGGGGDGQGTGTSATVVIPPYTVHGFQGFEGERLVMREVADPPGSYKAEYVLLLLFWFFSSFGFFFWFFFVISFHLFLPLTTLSFCHIFKSGNKAGTFLAD